MKNNQGNSSNEKVELPPEHLRKLMKDIGDFSIHHTYSKKVDKRIYLGALKYIPFAIYKLLENIPMPWQDEKPVKVLYHITGAITFVNEIPRVIEPIYLAQWATMFTMIKKEKQDRKHFKRIHYPIYDDDEPIINYIDTIQQYEDLEENELCQAIQLPFDNDDDDESKVISSWFYQHKPLINQLKFINGSSYKKWRLNIKIMSYLHRLTKPILLKSDDKLTYLSDKSSLFTGKL